MRPLCLFTLCCFLGACSFDVPQFQGDNPPGSGDAGGFGADLTPAPDQGILPDASAPDAAGDMPPLADLGQQDMPLDMQGTGDMDLLPDMEAPAGNLGQPCLPEKKCLQGRCVDVETESLCALSCVDRCGAGFVCQNSVCVPQDFCAGNDSKGPGCATCEKCAPKAECTQIAVGPGVELSCQCLAGYDGDGFTCNDADECALNTDDCDPNATCTNRPGGFDCVCKAGFLGDGKRCQKAPDACAMCDPNATCEGMGMDRTCTCRTGYQGDGTRCTDVDECLVNPCGTNAVCENVPGTSTCTCERGYEGDPTQGCVDTDECTVTPGICGANQVCANTAGGFNCSCPAPFKLDQGACLPLGSCAEIKRNFPATASGTYTISTLKGDLSVHCDMTTDNGAGYTLKRFDDPTLGATQGAYKALCSSWGMEVVTPRTQAHMDAIIAWNAEPPNLVNVVSPVDGAKGGLTAWQGKCQGANCGSFVTTRPNAKCLSLTRSNGTNRFFDTSLGTSCADYLADAPTHMNLDLYQIDADGPGPIPAAPAFCVMDPVYDQGGWTLTATVAQDGTNSWTWDTRTLWTTDTRTFGMDVQQDYKGPFLHTMPFRDVFFWHNSGVWGAYHNVGDGQQTLANRIIQTPAPNCDVASGFPLTAGTLTTAGQGNTLCSTSLYFNLGDYDGSATRCATYRNPNLTFPFDSSTYGPAWSQNAGQNCPFDDPADTSFGPNWSEKDKENQGLGYAGAMRLNPPGPDYLQLYLRAPASLHPDGNNAAGDLLIRTKTPAQAGPQCPYGSWDDDGDQVATQGWVICSPNDT